LSKLQNERVVKTGLASRVLLPSVVADIDGRVESVSKAVNLAGLIIGFIVREAISSRRDLPVFDKPFFVALFVEPDHPDDFPDIQFARSTAFEAFPKPQRYVGDSNTLIYAAGRTLTNFVNIVSEAFAARLKRRIYLWVGDDAARKKRAWPVEKAINGWGVQETTDAVAGEAEFVAEQRELLGNPKEITKAWLRSHVHVVLRAYHNWLTLLKRAGKKGFSLTPYFGIKRHFINFDTRVLRAIMTNNKELQKLKPDTTRSVERKGGDVEEPYVSDMLLWRSAFDFDDLATNKFTFSRMLDLDGVTGCFHFKAMKSAEELAAIEAATVAREAKKLETAARKKAVADDPAAAEARLKTERAEKKKTKAALAKEKKAFAASGVDELEGAYAPPDVQEGDSSTDPGASPNLLYTIYKKGGAIKRTRLTIGQYYTDSGVRKVGKVAEKLMKQIRGAQQHVDAASHRTASLDEFCQHLSRYRTVYDVLWKQKLRRVWARGRFRTYIGKPRALDAYFRKLKLDGAGVRRAYIGGGKWSPSQRGRETGPVDLVSRRFRRYHTRWVPRATTPHGDDGSVALVPAHLVCRARTVDENLTTQCCWRCGARTRPVFERIETDPETREENKGRMEVWKNDKMVRGLRFCDSKACGCLIDRDFQGAMNIMACGMAEDGGHARPLQLTSESKAMKRTDGFFLPSACARQARSGNQQKTSARPNLAYSSVVDVCNLELLLESCPILF
jgi:hypothetical protein